MADGADIATRTQRAPAATILTVASLLRIVSPGRLGCQHGGSSLAGDAGSSAGSGSAVAGGTDCRGVSGGGSGRAAGGSPRGPLSGQRVFGAQKVHSAASPARTPASLIYLTKVPTRAQLLHAVSDLQKHVSAVAVARYINVDAIEIEFHPRPVGFNIVGIRLYNESRLPIHLPERGGGRD